MADVGFLLVVRIDADPGWYLGGSRESALALRGGVCSLVVGAGHDGTGRDGGVVSGVSNGSRFGRINLFGGWNEGGESVFPHGAARTSVWRVRRWHTDRLGVGGIDHRIHAGKVWMEEHVSNG